MIMAIDLVYSDRSGQLRSIPVATFDYFTSVWLKAARELRLEIVPSLPHGRNLDPDSASALLLELGQLAEWATRKGQVEFARRVRALRLELADALEAGVTEFSVG